MTDHFADRVYARTIALQSPISAGIDPRPQLLPPLLAQRAGGSRRQLASAYVAFADTLLLALADVVPVVKLQIAFYEALGLPGIKAYQQTVRRAKQLGFIVIGDIKRADIGTSTEAYAEAHFGPAASAVGADVDAVTLNPYFGRDGLQPFLECCSREGRGAFALVRTSNPTARSIQDLEVDGRPVFEHVADLVESWGEDLGGASGYSSLGAVVGATYPAELAHLRRRHPRMLFLVPGYGAQGGTAGDVAAALDTRLGGALIASSRDLMQRYKEAVATGRDPHEWIRSGAIAMRDSLIAARAALPAATAAPPPRATMP